MHNSLQLQVITVKKQVKKVTTFSIKVYRHVNLLNWYMRHFDFIHKLYTITAF